MKIKLPGFMRPITNKIIKHAPEILTVAGVGGVVTGTVLACKATLKVSDDIEDLKNYISDVNDNDELSAEEKDAEIKHARIKAAGWIAKRYALPVAIESTGIGMIFGASHVYRKRAATTAAVLSSLNASYAAYRERVAAELGKDKELEIRYNTEDTDVEETVTDKNGKEKTKTVTKQKITKEGLAGYSPYARLFSRDTTEIGVWEDGPGYNYSYVKGIEDKWNNELRVRSHGGKKRGIVRLSEVYKDLGFDITPESLIAGWVFDPYSEKMIGDGYVSFGLGIGKYSEDPAMNRFIWGQTTDAILDFNCLPDVVPYM